MNGNTSSICNEFCDFPYVFFTQDKEALPKWAILLTHCILVDSSTVICWMSPLVILGVLGLFCHFYSIFDEKPVRIHYVVSDLGLHCLPVTLFRVSL